jgi:hypothetical protein
MLSSFSQQNCRGVNLSSQQESRTRKMPATGLFYGENAKFLRQTKLRCCVGYRTYLRSTNHYPLKYGAGPGSQLCQRRARCYLMIKKLDRFFRKSYAMKRMVSAIERAISLRASKKEKRATRWVAAWGLLCGIRTDGIRLRAGDAGCAMEERLKPRPVRQK